MAALYMIKTNHIFVQNMHSWNIMLCDKSCNSKIHKAIELVQVILIVAACHESLYHDHLLTIAYDKLSRRDGKQVPLVSCL